MTPAPGPDGAVAPLPGPRFATAWAALTYAVATLTLAWPALTGKFLVTLRSDQYLAGYAFREFAAESIRQGNGVPLWNPYLFGGLPYVAGMHGDIFYPTALLRVLLGTDTGMTWGFIVHVFLAGLFTFRFLRVVGLGFPGALVGGLAYMMGGNVAGLVSPGHDGKLFVASLLPLTLTFVYRGVREGRHWAWGALALTITLAVLTPHPQLLQYLLMTSGAFALLLATTTPDTGQRTQWPVGARRLGLAAIAVAIGLLGGAIQFLPLFEYTSWSPRAGGAGWAHAVSYSMPPEEMLNFYLPEFSGILNRYWGRNLIHFHSEYIGASVLVLAGLAFWRPLSRERAFLAFWAGVLAISLLWALGGHTPFYRIIYAVVPGTKFFRAPSTMLYIVAFSTAVLAALGTERLLSGERRSRYAVGWLIAGFVVAILATTGALTNVASSLADPQLIDRAEANAAAVVVGAWRSFAVVAATAAVIFALARAAISARLALWALVAIIVADLWSIERHYWGFSPPGSVLFASDPALEVVRRSPQPARMLPHAVQPLPFPDPYLRYGNGRAAGLMVHDVRSPIGYHGNELGRYQDLIPYETDPSFVQAFLNPNVRRLTNTRYWYTNAPDIPVPGLRRVAGPVTNAAGNVVYLFEFEEENPLAWVAPLAIEAPDENVLATVLDTRFDVRRVALFDTSAAIQPAAVPGSMPPLSEVSVRITRYEPGRISLTLDRAAPAGSALVVAENYYPGWRATIDGRAARVERVQYVLMGLPLPTGARTVDLWFESPAYGRGRAITIASLILSVLMLGAGALVTRRRRG